jgi:hypothetical protein
LAHAINVAISGNEIIEGGTSMSISKFTIYFSAMAVLLAAIPALAQREIHHVPPFVDADGYNPDVYHPFIAPDLFDPDYQFFAPAEFSEFGRGDAAPRGWFGSYDRLYLWVTRPNNQNSGGVFPGSQQSILGDNKAGDFGWGNRFDVGYMTAEDHGWLATFWSLNGPNHGGGPEVERISVFQALDEINNDSNLVVELRGGAAGGGGGAAMMMMAGGNQGRQGQPARDQNDPITGARDYRFNNSVNVASLSSFELNKTFRFNALHYGSTIEPFVGFRYMKFSDFFGRDSYERFDPDGVALGPGLPPAPLDLGDFNTEEFRRLQAQFDNHMVGGQVGLRWHKRKEKWKLSGELRAFAFQNFQSLESSSSLERTLHTPGATGGTVATVTGVTLDFVNFGGHADEFVFGTEIRAEAAYNVTRDFSIRTGMALMEMARGVGRGGVLSFNDQSVTIVGGTFGFQFNR